MTCEEYRDRVAEDADGRADDRALETRAHLEGCASCRSLREEQGAVRGLLRSRTLLEPAPPGLATRVRARLDDDGEPIPRMIGGLRAALLGLAAAALAFALFPRGVSAELGDVADSVRALERAAVAISADEPADLARRYAERLDRAGPLLVLDLAPALHLVGGTVREIHGAPARVTAYRTDGGRIVCHLVPLDAWSALAERLEDGAFSMTVEGIHFMIRRAGDEICILASRMPLEHFRAAVGAA